MKLLDDLTDFLFAPVSTMRDWLRTGGYRIRSAVFPWKLRFVCLRGWLIYRSIPRPPLFGARWDEDYRNLRAEAEVRCKQERWWEQSHPN